MRVLVTGGAGFIGSNLCAYLERAGDDVGVIDDLSTGKPDNLLSTAWFRELDILDPALPEAVAEFAPDAVVHLAAQPSVAASIADPARDWAVNAEGTALVASAAAAAGARRVISASSAAVYGEPAAVPLTEDAPTAPANPYGRSKLAAEAMLAEALAGTATDFASLRFSNVYGPRQDALGEGGVVAVFCHAIASAGTPVIFGTGHQTRDFVFVGDVVESIVAALRATGSLSGVFNVSTGSETPVLRLAEVLRDVTGFGQEFAHAPAREGDVERSSLDPARARSVLGWEAAMPLREGLAETWRWFAEGECERSWPSTR